VGTWVKGRLAARVAPRAAAFLLVLTAVLSSVLACGQVSPGGGTPSTTGGTTVSTTVSTTGPVEEAVLTVEEALTSEEGKVVNVRGAIVSAGGRTVLASALAESYPPQPGGAILPVTGLDLGSLVGLSSTVGQPGLAETIWSDYWLVLKGVIADGVLQVQDIPRVEEDTSVEGLRLRFSPVSEPIASGDPVWWALDVTNTGQAAVHITFSSGQRGDVILGQGGVDRYTWSEGKFFTQAIETVTLDPGGTLPVVLNDTLSVPAGDYQLTARVTATLGPEGSAAPLPDLVTTLTVR
jgi:hypothetical protein